MPGGSLVADTLALVGHDGWLWKSMHPSESEQGANQFDGAFNSLAGTSKRSHIISAHRQNLG